MATPAPPRALPTPTRRRPCRTVRARRARARTRHSRAGGGLVRRCSAPRDGPTPSRAPPAPGPAPIDSPPMSDQAEAPYLKALRAYAARDPERIHVPGHKGGPAADPELREAIGERALAHGHPGAHLGHRHRPGSPRPSSRRRQLAAEAWGAARSWFLVNGASQGNHVALLALAHAGERVVVQRNAHSSTVDGCILAGLTPTFVVPRGRPRAGHRALPGARDARSRRSRRPRTPSAPPPSRRPTSAPWPTWPRSPRWRTRTGCRWWWTRPGARIWPSTRSCPRTRSRCGADMVVSSTHKIVGSLTQSAMVHLGHAAAGRIDASVVDRAVTLVRVHEPQLAAARLARRRPPAGGHARARAAGGDHRGYGRGPRSRPRDRRPRRARRTAGGRARRARLRPAAAGHRRARHRRQRLRAGARCCASATRWSSSWPGENVIVGVFGMAEPAAPAGSRG